MLLYCLSIVLFYLLHSLLAANWLKSWVKTSIGLSSRHFRIVYNLISLLLLLWVYANKQDLSSEPLWTRWSWVAIPPLLTGLWVLYKATRKFNVKAFIGLDEEGGEQLVISGIYRYVRHPLYTGLLLLLSALLLWSPDLGNLIFVLLTLAYLPVGIWLEERKLVHQFGNDYLMYSKGTPALLPWHR